MKISHVVVACATVSLFAASCGPAGHRLGLADVDDFPDAPAAVKHSVLIVIGTPDGEARVLRTLPDGRNADWAEDVAVDTVLWGDVPPTVTIVRVGPAADTDEPAQGESLGGRLRSGRQVFLLQKSGEPEMYSIVGHDQGALKFDHGVVEDSPFSELNGMDKHELARYVRETMRKKGT
jgi:hypothetical protein